MGSCGCFRLEFDVCVKRIALAGCNASVLSAGLQWRYFCQKEETNCTVELAVRRMNSSYRAVGITEEFELSLDLFASKLPTWFSNATHVYRTRNFANTVHATAYSNNLTGTSSAGCVSNEARSLLHQMKWFQDEVYFYKQAAYLFWQEVARLDLIDL